MIGLTPMMVAAHICRLDIVHVSSETQEREVLDGLVHVIKVLQKIGRVFGEVPEPSAAIRVMACVMLSTLCVATQERMMALEWHKCLCDSTGSRLAIGLFMGDAVAKAQGGKFIDGVKGAAIGMGVVFVLGLRAPDQVGIFNNEKGVFSNCIGLVFLRLQGKKYSRH